MTQNKQKMKGYIRQHQAFLLRKSGHKILTLLALIFFCIVGLKLNAIYQKIKSLHSLEVVKLQSVSARNSYQMKNQHNQDVMILNHVREIFQIQIADSVVSNANCSTQLYLCQYTDLSLIKRLYLYSPLVLNSYEFLSSDSGKLLLVFEISTKQKIVFKHPRYKLKQIVGNDWQKDLNILVDYTVKQFQSSEDYVIANLQIFQSGQYYYQCGIFKKPFLGRACMIQFVSFPDIETLDLSQPIKIRDYNMQYRTLNSTHYDKQSKWSLSNFITKYAEKMLITDSSRPTLQANTIITYLEQSLRNNPYTRLITIYTGQFFQLFRTHLLITHFPLEYHQKYYSDLMYQVSTQVHSIHHFYIFSSRQFFQAKHSIVINGISEIQLIAQVMIMVAVLWIAILSYSQKQIQNVLCPTITGITQIAQVIIEDFKQHQADTIEWTRDIDKILEKNSICFFPMLIKYFKAFIWSKKIIHGNSNSVRRKNLLIQGLEFFNQSDFTPVLRFIYKQLVAIEQARITKLKKLRNFTKIPQQQGSRPIKTVKMRKEGMILSNLFSLKQIQDGQKSQPKQQKNEESYLTDFDIKRPETIFIAIQKKIRNKRGVRFSNQPEIRQLQTQRIKKKQTRKIKVSKLDTMNRDQSNKFSQKSIQLQKKSQTQIQQPQNEQKSQKSGKSGKSKKYENGLRAILKNLEQKSENDISGVKFDDNTQNTEINSQQQSQIEAYCYSEEQIQNQISISYTRIINYLESLIIILKTKFDKCSNLLDSKRQINQIYSNQVDKIRFLYKFYKHKTKYDDQFDPKEEQIYFDYLNVYEDLYEIDQALSQRATLYKMKVHRILEMPFCYKHLQNLCSSQNTSIRIEAKHLFALQFFQLEPHFDLEVVNRICENLSQFETSSKYKRKQLKLLSSVISKIQDFSQELKEVRLIEKYYNYNRRKFYFLADLGESFDIFSPSLRKIYELIDRLDLIRVYNLNYSDSDELYSEDCQVMKPSKVEHFELLFQQINAENSKCKSKTSTKTINKKLQCQKDFNNLLSFVEADQTEFSKYLIIILGGDSLNSHSIASDQADSSSYQNHRQIHQILHGQILKKIQKNYFHTILIGQHLSSYQTKQGKIKKYAKQSCDYLEVDLNKKSWQTHSKQIEKFLVK